MGWLSPKPRFEVPVEARNGVARIAVTGELDMATVPHLAEQLDRVEHDGVGAIILDLRHLSFTDTTGIQAFLDAHHRAATNGQLLALIGADRQTRRLFELTHTEFLLDGDGALGLLGLFAQQGDSDG